MAASKDNGDPSARAAAEEAAAAAAVEAAKADSVSRAMHRPEFSGREQLKVLKTENEALRCVAHGLAAGLGEGGSCVAWMAAACLHAGAAQGPAGM